MPPAASINRLFEDYTAKRVTMPFAEKMTPDDAMDVQAIFVRELQAGLGKPVGHKVGLVNREAQQRWGVDEPVRGVLLEKMILPDASEVPADFGASPFLEADLVVVVKDKAINRATTPLEAAKHLKEIAAFIELPDAFIATNGAPDGAMLAAANVGARLGVLGPRRPVKASREFVEALADMTMVMTDEAGLEMGRGTGKAILDQPLNALLWLIEDLQTTGDSLKPGDLVSLGAIRVMPVPFGHTVRVTYEGLPGGPLSASVRLKGK
jgi:2-oxo-hept-3-ene-1,7-dioate hydratase